MVWRERRHLLPFRPNDDGLEVRLRKVTARATESHTTTTAIDLACASVRECHPTERAPLSREILESLCRRERSFSHRVAARVAVVPDDHKLGVSPGVR